MLPILSLLSSLALGASPCDDALYWSHGTPPTPSYDDENCFVEVPQGVPFVYNNSFYTEPTQDSCPMGWFDGVNCYVQHGSPGAFIYRNTFYTRPWMTGQQCPSGSWFDGANCYWFAAPAGHEAFIYRGNWYLSPGPNCHDGVYDQANCYHGAAPEGTEAFIHDGAFYYTYDETTSAEALRHTATTCGSTYEHEDLLDCINEYAPLRPSIMRGISTPEADYHGDAYDPQSTVRPAVMATWRDGCSGSATQLDLGDALPVDNTSRVWPRSPVRAGDVVQHPFSRTSNDGRIVLSNYRMLTTFRPEAVGYDDEGTSQDTWAWSRSIPKAHLGMHSAEESYHATICDDSGGSVGQADLSSERNPRTCTWTEPGHGTRTGDCYDLTLLYAVHGHAGYKRWWLGSLDVTVMVDSPKTPLAASYTLPRQTQDVFTTPQIPDVSPSAVAGSLSLKHTFWLDTDLNGTPDPDEQWNGCQGSCPSSAKLGMHPDFPRDVSLESLDIFEITTTADGRLMILNTMDGVYYSYNQGTPCSAAGFERWLPLSYMPSDPQVAHYDLAKSGAVTGGFRDTNGVVIRPGDRIDGAYTWVDRQAKNLFWARTNTDRDGWKAVSSYPGTPNALQDADDPDHINGKGVVVMGAWTQGKMIQVDNMLNATDWGGMYTCESVPWNHSAKGGGQMLRVFDMPLYRDQDPLRVRPARTSMIGSSENQFNQFDGLSPTLPADVVWRVSSNNGHTAEMAFDDYMRNDAFVVAHMNASQRRNGSMTNPRAIPWDGFVPLPSGGDDFGFQESPRIQNASTASTAWTPDALRPPSNLRLLGGARIEPVAIGGVQGKGVFLDGRNDHMDMGYPNTGRTDWSYSIWLDLRSLRHGELRTIFHWADGSWVAVSETTVRAYHGPTGITRDVDVSHLGLESGRYFHLSIDSYLQDHERVLDVFIDGDPHAAGTARFPICSTWTCSPSGGFSMDWAHGRWSWFVVGSYDTERTPPTFRGWVDELRIFALDDRTSLHRRELRCNQALGTIRGFGKNIWCEQLQLQSHDTTLDMGPQRGFGYCIDKVHRNDQGTSSLCNRDHLLGVAGLEPIAGTPRADQTANGFCLTCHFTGHPIDGLTVSALAANGVARECDDRRQPMDWVGVMGGAVPVPQAPTMSTCTPSEGWLADPIFDILGKLEP